MTTVVAVIRLLFSQLLAISLVQALPVDNVIEEMQCECAFAVDDGTAVFHIVYEELPDGPLVNRSTCYGLKYECGMWCSHQHQAWWADNNLHTDNPQTGADYGDGFCQSYGKYIPVLSPGLPLVTVGRIPQCPGFDQWMSTELEGLQRLCCIPDWEDQAGFDYVRCMNRPPATPLTPLARKLLPPPPPPPQSTHQ